MTYFNDDERLSRLIDLARHEVDEEDTRLSSDELREVGHLRVLFRVIDGAWTIPSALHDQVESAFFRQLATTQPDHPWVQARTVQTLGDLIHAAVESAPNFPMESLTQLEQDPTPITEILDAGSRSVVVGRAIARASVPPSLVIELVHWLNHAVAELISTPGSAGKPQLVFARRQSKQQRKPV